MERTVTLLDEINIGLMPYRIIVLIPPPDLTSDDRMLTAGTPPGSPVAAVPSVIHHALHGIRPRNSCDTSSRVYALRICGLSVCAATIHSTPPRVAETDLAVAAGLVIEAP